MNSVELGQMVKRLRLSRKLRQRDFAKMLDVSQAQYCRLESGICELSVSQLAKIADCLLMQLRVEILSIGIQLTHDDSRSKENDAT